MPAALREIGFDQFIDQSIPLDVPFRDESGRTVQLGDYFGKRPVVLVFAYYDCPMLCTQVINGLSTALNVLSLEPNQDFEIVTVSFNPKDTPATAAAKKAMYLERYQRSGAAAGWHFLSGDQPSIDRLTKAAGFRYVWDEKTNQFAHPSGVIVLTPKGGSRGISSASSTALATCASRSSKHRRAASARWSMRCCSTATTTTR